MLATLIIVFREIIEAGLVVGIVLAATHGVARRGLWVALGVAAGVAGACLVAAFAGSIAHSMAGAGQELFNATIMAIAVVMLASHNVWMARQGRRIAARNEVAGGGCGRAATAPWRHWRWWWASRCCAKARRSCCSSTASPCPAGNTAASMYAGGAIGFALGAVVSALMYFGLLRIPARHLFAVTSWLIALLAAGMAAQAVVFLQQAGLVTVLSHALWNSSSLVSDGSLAGKTLHTLIGYTDRPTGIQLIAYLGTLATIFTLMRLFGQPTRSNG